MRHYSPLSCATTDMTKFARVSDKDWTIAETIGTARIRRLKRATNFESVVARLVRSARVEQLKRERARECPSAFRAVVILRVEPASLDDFFNSHVGYRAQYFVSRRLGEKANRFAISRFLRKVLAAASKRECPNQSFLKASLTHPYSKVWLHQGVWLRRAKREDRVLLVRRWQAELDSNDKLRQKLARWGSLAPANEMGLVLKGGYIGSTARVKMGKLPATRSKQLNELGFT